MKKRLACFLPFVLAASGCSLWPKGDFSASAENSVRSTDIGAAETATLASLSQIEEAIRDYYTHEHSIPEDLNVLVPQYMPEIPNVELGLRVHRDTNRVTIYTPDILVAGVVDGAKIRDTGGWGYVHTDRQVVVFVDCTHQSSNGVPWYSRQP